MGAVPLQTMSGISDRGRVRDHNEDTIRWDAINGWAILADGMGGHLAGEVASALASETIARCLASVHGCDAEQARAVLQEAVAVANRTIHEQSISDPRYRGMGSTVVATLIHNGLLSCAYVGDSRLYRFNAEGLVLLSHDHSLVQELVDEGYLSREEAASSIHRNVISRALGLQTSVEVDIVQVPAISGDLFLLCSDGLSDKIPDQQLANFLKGNSLDSTARQLVNEANQRGGEDNISVILIRIE